MNCPSCGTALIVPGEAARVELPRAALHPPVLAARRLVALVLFAFVAWLYFTPHMAVRSLRKAAEAQDAEGVSARVDFPSLRTSLKANFNAVMAKEMAHEGQDANAFAAMGTALAAMFTDKIVDSLVTPEALSMMLQGEKPNADEPRESEGQKADSDAETSMGYRSFNTFVVRTREKGSTDEPIELIFARHGLASWKLSALRLPMENKSTRAAKRTKV